MQCLELSKMTCKKTLRLTINAKGIGNKMLHDWRENKRWHLFKSATGKFILVDHNESDDWKLYEKSFASYCLELLVFGVAKKDSWIDDLDFTDEEKAKLEENMM